MFGYLEITANASYPKPIFFNYSKCKHSEQFSISILEFIQKFPLIKKDLLFTESSSKYLAHDDANNLVYNIWAVRCGRIFLFLKFDRFQFFLLQYLRINVFKADFAVIPSYGNVSYIAGNETHMGNVTFQYLQKIPSYEIASSYKTLKGNAIMDHKIKPCDSTAIKRMAGLIDKSLFKSFDEENLFFPARMPCPLEVNISLRFIYI